MECGAVLETTGCRIHGCAFNRQCVGLFYQYVHFLTRLGKLVQTSPAALALAGDAVVLSQFADSVNVAAKGPIARTDLTFSDFLSEMAGPL